jgi:anti-anti-sigma factor
MNQQLSNLPLPSRWEPWKARPPSGPQGTLTMLRPAGPIFAVLPLEHGHGLRLMGELCLSTIGALETMLNALPAAAGVLDVSALTFMDSTGLHAFERHARRLEQPRPLVLLNASEPVRRLFELTGAYLNPDIELRNDGGRG